MSYIVKIHALSRDRFLKEGKEVDTEKQAQRFRSHAAAEIALGNYLGSLAPVVRRNVSGEILRAPVLRAVPTPHPEEQRA